MIFFTSDHHFDHANIIKLGAGRPFGSVEEMNEAMIANWNAVVKENDTVYYLGDFAYKSSPEHAAEIGNRLNGSVEFNVGNHDEALIAAYEVVGWLPRWKMMPLYHTIQPEKKLSIVMCHYAMRDWQYRGRGVWHLFGHSHGGISDLGRSTDVGVDRWNFTPVSLDQLKEYMQPKAIY